jgi:hypothetical protein
MLEDEILENFNMNGKTRIIFGYPISNGFYNNFDKDIFTNIVNVLFHSNVESEYREDEGHNYYLDNLRYECHFPGPNSENDRCARENILQVSDWVSCDHSDKYYQLPDCSQISSKSPIGFRIEQFERNKVNIKDFPPSNQYHHIESFSKIKIKMTDFCEAEFLRLKDITDNIISHQIYLYPLDKQKDNIVRLLSVIDGVINLINPLQIFDVKNVRKNRIVDLR